MNKPLASYSAPDPHSERHRSRFRTDKSRTRRYIELMFGPKEKDMQQDNPNTAAIDKLADDITVPAHKVLAYNLWDIARELNRLGNELEEDGEIEPVQVRLLVRRLAAAHHASIELYPVAGKGNEATAKEILAKPHRMKGVEIG